MEKYTVANDIIGRVQERYKEIKNKKDLVMKFDWHSPYSGSLPCMMPNLLCTLW